MKPMTVEQLNALPLVVDLSIANRALGISRTLGYDLAGRGEYPVQVLRLGRAYRVTRADLLKLLGDPAPTPTTPPADDPDVEYEYGIRRRGTDYLHRKNMTAAEAREFMADRVWKGLPFDHRKVFEVVRRPLGDWQPVDQKGSTR